MDTTVIETIIADRRADPDLDSDLLDLLAAVAESRGKAASDDDLRRGAGFTWSYIEQVPYLIKVAWTAARNVGLETEMGRVLAMVTSYWERDDDVIPDKLGVIGLLDDAYCSLASLQAVSDHFQLQTGKFLFPDDLTAANQAMRLIIGEPYASDLDRIVIQTLQETRLIDSMKRLASVEKQLDFSNHSTIWSHGPAGRSDLRELAALGLIVE